jgi:hypothetical protein
MAGISRERANAIAEYAKQVDHAIRLYFPLTKQWPAEDRFPVPGVPRRPPHSVEQVEFIWSQVREPFNNLLRTLPAQSVGTNAIAPEALAHFRKALDRIVGHFGWVETPDGLLDTTGQPTEIPAMPREWLDDLEQTKENVEYEAALADQRAEEKGRTYYSIGSFLVGDKQGNAFRFDPAKAVRCWIDGSNPRDRLSLYRLPDRSWLLICEFADTELPAEMKCVRPNPYKGTCERISDEEAAKWLLQRKLILPPDLRCSMKRLDLLHNQGRKGGDPLSEGVGQAQTGKISGNECIGMSDLQFVNAALWALEELIKACTDFQLAGVEHPTTPCVQLAPFQVVKSRVVKMTAFATSRLDRLCVKYLRTRPGDWSDRLIETVRDPIRVDKGDDYENELRARWNELSKLGIILANDAGEAASVPARPQSHTTVDRLHIDDIENFAQVRTVQPCAVAGLLKDGRIEMSEDSIKRAIEEILQVPFHHNDRPNELDDIYTANVIVQGSRRPTALMLKGPGIGKKEMTIADCGKNGDQLVRLFDAPADLFVVQYVGRIGEMVIKDVEGKIAALYKRGKKAQYLIVDGQDTARLLFAYGKLITA